MDVTENNNFILIPASTGGGALVRRSEIAGGRANGDGCILYLRSGPSVYSTATIPQIARYLSADVAHLNRD
jgi:hypothetical protein